MLAGRAAFREVIALGLAFEIGALGKFHRRVKKYSKPFRGGVHFQLFGHARLEPTTWAGLSKRFLTMFSNTVLACASVTSQPRTDKSRRALNADGRERQSRGQSQRVEHRTSHVVSLSF